MYSVYALCDPETFEAYYIGCSLDVRRRYLNHFQKSQRRSRVKHAWLDYLEMQGLRPVLIVLEGNIKEPDAFNREAYWIAYYHNLGAPLTNLRQPDPNKPIERVPTTYYVYSDEEYEYMKSLGRNVIKWKLRK